MRETVSMEKNVIKFGLSNLKEKRWKVPKEADSKKIQELVKSITPGNSIIKVERKLFLAELKFRR